jgi:hypothetical protein
MLLLLSTEPPAPVWPTKFGAVTGCNLRPLGQWGDAMLPISREEQVMSLGGHSNFSSGIFKALSSNAWAAIHELGIDWASMTYI